jgi:Flp pilus assembly pilin Flp
MLRQSEHVNAVSRAAPPTGSYGRRARRPRRRRLIRVPWRSDDGQTMIEFALLLPLLVILALGFIAFGFALNDWIDETQLTAQAARFAAVASEHGNGEELKPASFLKWITAQGDNNNVREATATMCSPTSKVGDWVEVKLTYKYKWFGLGAVIKPFYPATKFPGETPLTSTSRMRIEQAPIAAYPTAC